MQAVLLCQGERMETVAAEAWALCDGEPALGGEGFQGGDDLGSRGSSPSREGGTS
jgi:hypothetical protein